MRLLLATLTLVTLLARTARADDTTTYVVQAGDSCIGIAIKLLGDRTAVRELHRLNPQLGALPHHLVPGSQLVVPARKPDGPDAKLTRASGDVKFRKPSALDWDPADLGMELFRAYRVGAPAKASAELTFADEARIAMRERTIVVIYGPEKRLAKLLTATADLERGTLESRLGELDGKPIVVRTQAAQADLRAGDVVLSAQDGGPSVVSNHRGAAVALRSRSKKATVKVAAGMGTRVLPGQAPEPPRPLPATPAWRTTSGMHIPGTTGSIELAWSAVERAASYRLAIRRDDDSPVSALTLDAPLTTARIPLAPGAYRISIAALDADLLESPPADLAVVVVELAFMAPNGRLPADSATTPRTVALGTTVIAPAGVTCAIAGAPAARVVLDTPGTVALTCRSGTGDTAALTLDVLGHAEVPRDSTLPAPRVANDPPTSRLALGAFTGFHTVAVREPLALGETRALDAGPTLGVRAGLGLSRRFGVEAELALSSLDRIAEAGRSTATSTRVHGLVRYDEGWASLRLLAGAGASFADDDSVLTFSWGAALGLRTGRLELRLDLRHELGSGRRDGVASALQTLLGAALDL